MKTWNDFVATSIRWLMNHGNRNDHTQNNSGSYDVKITQQIIGIKIIALIAYAQWISIHGEICIEMVTGLFESLSIRTNTNWRTDQALNLTDLHFSCSVLTFLLFIW